RHAEAVGREALGRRGVAGRGRSVEEVDVVRPMLDTVAQDVDRAALADLALEPREELPPGGTVVAQVERLGRLRLRRAQESREVRKVHAVLPVVVGGIAADVPGSSIRSSRLGNALARRSRVARAAGQRHANQALESFLAGVALHAEPSIKYPSSTLIY